jgi:hypothetical protein
MAIPQGANQRWSLDFLSDTLSDGRRFRILAVVDDFSIPPTSASSWWTLPVKPFGGSHLAIASGSRNATLSGVARSTRLWLRSGTRNGLWARLDRRRADPAYRQGRAARPLRGATLPAPRTSGHLSSARAGSVFSSPGIAVSPS